MRRIGAPKRDVQSIGSLGESNQVQTAIEGQWERKVCLGSQEGRGCTSWRDELEYIFMNAGTSIIWCSIHHDLTFFMATTRCWKVRENTVMISDRHKSHPANGGPKIPLIGTNLGRARHLCGSESKLSANVQQSKHRYLLSTGTKGQGETGPIPEFNLCSAYKESCSAARNSIQGKTTVETYELDQRGVMSTKRAEQNISRLDTPEKSDVGH